MNRFIQSVLFILTVMVLFQFSAYADEDHEGGNGHFHPDSLEMVTVSGAVIVDSLMMYPIYYLDENGDNEADYHLNFGPSWYQPDSSLATRPKDGEEVTIFGGLYISHEDSFKIVVVYEINGLLWRQPFDALWNNMGGHHGDGGHHTGHGYAFGWMHDTPEIVNVNGKVLVDTTFIHEFYYLDENEDNQPDYFLNFGPPWYEPVSDAQRPIHGQSVSILGAEMDQHTIPMLIVYEIDGQVWCDSSSFGFHFGGGWIDRDMDHSRSFHTPYDTLDWMTINPGWHNGMGHNQGGMMSDSLFCQILEIFPENLPHHEENHFFAGYEIGIFNPDGHNNMWEGDHESGRMSFSSNADFMMHYNEIQFNGFNINEDMIKVHYWDNQSGNWINIPDAIIDPVANTVSFSTSDVGTLFALSSDAGVTSIEEKSTALTDRFDLKQNYPNPFNPVTTIAFDLNKTGYVILSVYNVLGQKVMVLVDEVLEAGSYNVKFDARNFPSGTYFYELSVNNQKGIKKLTILK
jgi:hypothetical protein